MIIICLFLYFSLLSKKAEADAVCLRRFSVTRLSWLHDDVSPFIQKGSVSSSNQDRSSCSQLSTKGLKMWCVLKIWIKKISKILTEP